MHSRAAALLRVTGIALLPFVFALGVLYPRFTLVFGPYSGPLTLTIGFTADGIPAAQPITRTLAEPTVPFANLEMPISFGFPNLRFDGIVIDTGIRQTPAPLRSMIFSTALFRVVLSPTDINRRFTRAGTVLTGNAALAETVSRFKSDYILASLAAGVGLLVLFSAFALLASRVPRLKSRNLPRGIAGAALLFLILLAALLFEPFLSGRYQYLFVDLGFDTFNQYFPFLSRWKERYDSLGIPFWPMWSFEMGPGTNIGPVLADPFHLLFLLFGANKAALPAWLAALAPAKIVLAGVIFYLFLRTLRVSREAALLGGLCYAFNGFLIIWGQHPQYSTFTVYLALLLYGFELYRSRKTPAVLLLACFLLTVSHIFFFLVSLPFLFLYAAARFSEREPLLSRKVLIRLASLLPVVLLGCSLAAFYALPQLEIMISSPRTAGRWRFLQVPFFDPDDDLGRVTVITRMIGNDLTGTGNDFDAKGNYYNAPELYAGLVTLFLAVQYFILSRGRSRRAPLLPFAVFTAALFSPRLRTILYALVEDFFRELSLFWTTIVVILAVRALDRAQRLKTFAPKGIAFAFAAICVAADYGERGDFVVHVLAFAGAYALLMYFFRPGRFQPAVLAALLVIPALELSLFSRPALTDRGRVPADSATDPEGYNDFTMPALAQLKELDPGHYRIDKPYHSVFFNDPLVQSYHGLSGYFSFLNRPYREFLVAIGMPILEKTRRYLSSPVPNWGAFRILGVKYVLALHDPFGGTEADLIKRAGPVNIFRLREPRSLAFTVRAAVSESEFRSLGTAEQNRLLERAAVLPPESPLVSAAAIRPAAEILASGWDGVNGEISEMSDSRLSGTITSPVPALLFLSVPFDRGWRLRVDGREVNVSPVSIGFTGAEIAAGAHRIELDFLPWGFVPGVFVSAIGWIAAGALVVRRHRAHSATARPNPARP